MSGDAGAARRAAASKDRLRLWLRLLSTTRGIEAVVREKFRAEFATTLPRFDVLAALERAGTGLTMTALSRALRVSNGNVTGIIDRLVADGLVLRATIEGDRRSTRVALTEKGRGAFAKMAAAHERWIDELLGDLGGAEVLDTIARLERMEAPFKKETA